MLPYVIWDGLHDYENVPPLQIIALREKMQGLQLYVQVGADSVKDIHEVIACPYRACPEAGGLVIWTRDHQTYRRIVRRLMRMACGSSDMEGSLGPQPLRRPWVSFAVRSSR
jgi:hypothetical protein